MRPPEMATSSRLNDTVVVVRGGPHSLDFDKVIEVCEDSFADFGFYRLLVFAALDGDVETLCLGLERPRSPGTIWVASCGRLRAEGFSLAATDASPHFDVVLASSMGLPLRPYGCVSSPATIRSSVDEEVAMVRQLTVDFNRTIDGFLIRANARRAVPGTALAVGSVIVVGDDDWGVVRAEVVEHDAESGSLVLRLLGDLVDERLDRLSRPA